MASKFSQKAAAIHFNLPAAESLEGAAEPGLSPQKRPPRTAIGSHVDALYRDRELADERDQLQTRLNEFEGAVPTRRLDPNDVVLSRFASRHPDSYRDAEYKALREEIRAAGGNTQPIGVRPLTGQPGKYELSFGSRRRQACLDEGLLVLAMIEEMDELQLFERMERENRQRKNLRPYEQGMLYHQALDNGLFPSVRKLADELQIDATGLSRLLAIARLPRAVLDAFSSPLDIQFDWGALLNEALQRNPESVLAKAAELKTVEKKAPRFVFDQLVSAAGDRQGGARPGMVEVRGARNEVAKLKFGRNSASVKITNWPTEKRAALEQAIRKLLA